MPTSNGVIPFTELVETVKDEELRDTTVNVEAENKYKAVVNDTYRLWIPLEFEFKAYRKIATITTKADYTTGTVAATSVSNSITGSSTSWTSSHDGMKIWIKSADEVYDFTYVSATSATLDRNFVGSTTTSSNYILYQYRYALASDFWRPVKTGYGKGSFWYYKNGVRVDLLPEWSDKWSDKDIAVPGVPSNYRIVYSGGLYYVDIFPPDTESRTIFYEYIPYLSPMKEYTTGTVSVTNGSKVVTGSGTDFSSNVSAGDYFRIDGDGTGSASVWYKIDSVDSATQITLETAYAGTTQSGVEYTISEAPNLPPVFHPLIKLKACIDRATDRDAKQLQVWTVLLSQYLGRAKQIDEGYNYDTSLESIYQQYNYRG